jgi:hypothetical protein
MKIKVCLILLSLTLPTTSIASEAGNILACINAVKTYTGKTVDEFDVNYTGRFIKFSTAEWTGIKCEVSLDSVHSLKVDGTTYVVDGFAGYPAKSAYETIEKRTEDAISLLESRIKLLERRLDGSEQKLKLPNPNISEIKEYIETGISKATGQ